MSGGDCGDGTGFAATGAQGDGPFPYDELGSRMVQLKRAALDAYMKENGFDIHFQTSGEAPFHGRTFFKNGWWVVSQPDANLQGGGDCYPWPPVGDTSGWGPDSFPGGWHNEFANLFRNLDCMLSGLDAIPDPDLFSDQVKSLQLVAAGLATTWTQGHAKMPDITDGTIDAFLVPIQNTGSDWGGEFATVFLQFIGVLPDVLANACRATLALEGTIAGEREMFARARGDVTRLVQSATDCFRAYAEAEGPTDSFPWETVLKVVGSILDIVSVVYPPAAVGVGIYDAAVDLVTALTPANPPEPVQPRTSSFTDVHHALGQSLANLTEATVDEDKSAGAAMTSYADLIHDAADGCFAWKKETMDDYGERKPGTPPTLIPPTANEIPLVSANLDGLSAHFERLTKELANLADPRPWKRPFGLGRPYFGFYDQWADMLQQLTRRVGDLAVAVLDCRAAFVTGATNIIEADQDISDWYQAENDAVNKIPDDPTPYDPTQHIRVPGHGGY